MQKNCRSFRGLKSLCFRSASPAEALSHLTWFASTRCDNPPVTSSAVLLQEQNTCSLELLGWLDRSVYSHTSVPCG